MVNIVYLERTRIKHLMEKALQKPLLCICAGAGYGKTSTVHSFLQKNKITSTWLQISSRDNLGERFWENYVYAFTKISRKGAEKFRKLGFPSTGEVYNRYTSILKASLLPGEKYVFVYDDVHLLEDKQVLRFLELSITASIINFSSILIYRWEPELNIRTLINRKIAAEIKERELCFTKDEMLSYYKLLNLTLSPGTASAVYKDTEGWAFAIHLAGFSLKNSGGSSYIPQILKTNINKLIESEIIVNLDTELRHTLIKLSLIEDLDRNLIKEIINNPAASGGVLNPSPRINNSYFEKIINKIPIYINYDNSQNTYHIHHLFREYLKGCQNELNEEEKKDIYNKAALWCIANNRKIDAIMYFQKAANLQGLMEIFYSMPLLLSRQTAALVLETLDSFSDDIYDEYTQAFVMRNRAMASLRLFEQSRKETLEKLPHYLAMQDSVKKHLMLLISYVNLASIAFVSSVQTRDYNFSHYFQKAARHAKLSSNITKAPLNGDILGSYVCRVRAPATKEVFDDYIKMLKNIVHYSMEAMGGCRSGLYELALGEFAFFRGDYKEAMEYLRQSLKKAKEKEQYEIENRSLFYMLRTHLCQGSFDKIKSIMQQFKGELEEKNFPNRYSYYDLCTAFYFLQTGENDKIAVWIKSEFHESALVSVAELLEKFIQAKYLFNVKKYPAALAVIESRGSEEALVLGEIEMKALEALCHYRQKNREKAYRALKDAYKLSEESGIITCFTEFGKDMRTLAEAAIMDKAKAIPVKWLEKIRMNSSLYAKKLYPLKKLNANDKSSLSRRENDVLRLICQGFTRNEIADNFNISPNTVKTIIKSIYNKLGAANKADAVRIAEERKL